MKMTYETPLINVVEVRIEKGFATSGYSLQQFEYDDVTGADENTAW